jgi:hypothetical protein
MRLLEATMMTKNTTDTDVPSKSAKADGPMARYRRMYRAAGSRSGGRRAPHPGDILYWLTCLGAACLLILAAT